MTKVFSFTDALLSLRPGSEWTLYGNDYSKLIWHHTDSEPPTEQELLNEVARLQQAWTATEYQRQRAKEYPSLQDLADALYWQAQGNLQPMTDYLAACAAVKALYPKGDDNA